MKKILLFFVALFACVGSAWAQAGTEISDLANLSNSKSYVLQTPRGNWVYDETDATHLGGTTRKGIDADATNVNQQWAILKSDKGNYYFYSVGGKKFVYAQGNSYVMLSDEVKSSNNKFIAASTSKVEAGYPFVPADGSYQFNMSTNQASGVLSNWNDTNDEGNAHKIIEAADFDATEALALIASYESTVKVSYTYVYNGTDCGSETFEARINGEFPKPTTTSLKVGVGLLDYTLPEGTVTEEKAYTVELSLKSTFPFQTTTITDGAFAADTKWYTMTLKEKYAYYDEDNQKYPADVDTQDFSDKFLWAFTGDPINGYQIYNKASGATKAVYDNAPANAGAAIAPNESPSGTWSIGANNAGYWMMESDGENAYMNSRSSAVSFWTTAAAKTDDGSRLKFAIADIEVVQNLLASDLSLVGTDPGYYTVSDEVLSAVKAVQTKGTEATFEEVLAAISNLTTAWTMNPIVPGYYYFVNGGNFSKDMAVYSDGENAKWKALDKADASMIWHISAVAEKATDKTTITNLKDNLYFGNTAFGAQVTMTSEENIVLSYYSLGYAQFLIKANALQGLHFAGHNNGAGTSGNIVNYNSGPNSYSALYLRTVTPESVLAILAETIKSAESQVGTKLCQYNPTEAYNTALAAAKAMTAADEILDILNANDALKKAVSELSDYNAPVAGKKYIFYNEARGKFMNVDDSKIYVTTESYAYVTFEQASEAGKYYIKVGDYYANSCVKSTNTTLATTTEGTHEYTVEPYNGKVVFHDITNNNDYSYLHAAGHDPVVGWTIIGGASQWTVYEPYDMLKPYQGNTKFDILEGSTVMGPGEFAAPETLNADFDYLNALTAASSDDDIIAALNSESLDRVKNYQNQIATWGKLANIQFELKAKYGTLILPCPSYGFKDLTIYTCEALEDNGIVLKLTKNDNFAAKTAYILEGTAGSKYTIIGWDKTKAVDPTSHTTGVLTGVLVPTTVEKGNYVLQNQSKGLGFYEVTALTGFQLGANRCYLTVPEGTSASNGMIRISDGTVTAIEAVEALTSGNTEIFDLQGRRINSLQKGVNIVNGHKVLVK